MSEIGRQSIAMVQIFAKCVIVFSTLIISALLWGAFYAEIGPAAAIVPHPAISFDIF
jgi:hypothetical protein